MTEMKELYVAYSNKIVYWIKPNYILVNAKKHYAWHQED